MSITAVSGVRVGHWSDPEGRTGCTVVLLPPDGAVAGVDVRGSAPGTRETDVLRPGMVVDRVHAIALCGGSAFGLAAADGVMRYLAERGIGFQVEEARIPIVPAAVIFDLAGGHFHPGPDEGYAACLDAELGSPCAEGAVGAGTGATVGKLLGRERASPGGVGTASVRLPGGPVVGALAVVNAVGDVVDEDGRVLAGARAADGTMRGAWRAVLEHGRPPATRLAGGSTTIAVLATDAGLAKVECRRLAELGHDALARSIRPVHTTFDGDSVFAVSTGSVEADPTALGLAVIEALSAAIRRAVNEHARG